MTLYKLTNENLQTFNKTQWGDNISHEVSGEGNLCSSGWLHAYTSPLLAVLMNPVHAAFKNPVLWEAEGEIGISDGTKVGCKKLTTIRQIPLPEVTTEQKVKFGILCAKQVYKDEKWNLWADNWLNGKDRSTTTAAAAAYYAANAAAYYTANAATYYAAAAAIYYAANAAANAAAYYAANYAAYYAANAAANYAANYAANDSVDFEELAKQSMLC